MLNRFLMIFFVVCIFAAGVTGCKAGNGTVKNISDERAAADTDQPFVFNYEGPKLRSDEPALITTLHESRDRDRAELEKEARLGKRDAMVQDYAFHPYQHDISWQVEAELDNWISLSGSDWFYYGGAHGATAFRSTLWDRRSKSMVDPVSLFTDRSSMFGAIAEQYCTKLYDERAGRGVEQEERTAGSSSCVDPERLTFVLTSRQGQGFDQIQVLAAHYAVGAYYEGMYAFTFPVTDAVIETVKPQFRSDFSIDQQ